MLYLDDFRDPPDKHWTLARSTAEAIDLVKKHGFPEYVSFDHDLRGQDTGMEFAKFLVNLDLEHHLMPKNFRFTVHSQNPVGAANITALMEGYMAHRSQE